jgi:hypothetical protein
MFEALPALTARLTSRHHAGHRPFDPSPYDHSPYDRSPYDLDGACPACDHPFGLSDHICIGAVTRTAS